MGEIQIYKSPTDNSLEFEIDIGPDNDAYNDYNLTEILEFTGADIEITQADGINDFCATNPVIPRPKN